MICGMWTFKWFIQVKVLTALSWGDFDLSWFFRKMWQTEALCGAFSEKGRGFKWNSLRLEVRRRHKWLTAESFFVNGDNGFLRDYIHPLINFEPRLYCSSCLNSTLCISERPAGCWWRLWTCTLQLRPQTSPHELPCFRIGEQEISIWVRQTPSAPGECILVPTDRLVTFIWPGRCVSERELHVFWLILPRVHRVPCFLSSIIAKTTACADTCNPRAACYTHRDQCYLRDSTILPRSL